MTDLSTSIAGNAIVGIIPQALVGPRNWLLLMIGVGKHNSGQARSTKQAVEHDCDAAESQSTMGQLILELILSRRSPGHIERFAVLDSGQDTCCHGHDGYPFLLGKRALEQHHSLVNGPVACSKLQRLLAPLCAAGRPSWIHGGGGQRWCEEGRLTQALPAADGSHEWPRKQRMEVSLYIWHRVWPGSLSWVCVVMNLQWACLSRA